MPDIPIERAKSGKEPWRIAFAQNNDDAKHTAKKKEPDIRERERERDRYDHYGIEEDDQNK